MKRITAALKGLVEKAKKDRKIARINRSIEAAMDNARDEIDRIDERMASTVEELSKAEDINCVLYNLSDLISAKEEQNNIISRLEEIQEYLDEEIEVEEED